MLHRNIRGKSLHAPSSEVVENNTGAPIPKLKVVSLNGFGSLFPSIVLANPLLSDNFGIVQENIENGKYGYVTCIGFMFDIDTSAWPVDTQLYSDSSGNLSIVPSGTAIALVVKSDADTGVLYVSGPPVIFRQRSWLLAGNSGTDENYDYIGTNDNKGLLIKTNSQLRLKITDQGRFGFNTDNPDSFIHIKAHTDYPKSGRKIDTFAVQTTDTAYNLMNAISIPLNSAVMATVSIVGRKDDNSFCFFKKTFVAKRGPGMMATLLLTQSDFTHKSDSNYDLRFRRVYEHIYIEVKSAVSDSTSWTGTIEIDTTSTPT